MRGGPNELSQRTILAAAILLAGCEPDTAAVQLRSLDASGRTSLVCVATRDSDADFVVTGPRELSSCRGEPQFEGEIRRLLAMVTQTVRGEVAIVDLSGQAILDLEPTIPGFNFLPVGASPVSIVSTPGSVATFVGVGEAGREGIYALPWSCLFQPKDIEGPVPREVATWPACRLPSAPGDMAILIDPPENDLVRLSCDSTDRVPAGEQPPAAAHACSADLSVEAPPGRRKLAVALPDRGEIAILDAQAILDRKPGSFDECPIERYLSLRVDLPAVRPPQVRPDDLGDDDCAADPTAAPDEGGDAYFPRPAGFAQVDDTTIDEHRLFVADLAAPVVHVLETKDPCGITESAPLLPMSLGAPHRVVTTRRVAASPLTTGQKRFLYAVDDRDRGSVMAFDVSQDSTNPTPIVRPGAPLVPFEPADRILFEAPVQDLAFARRDRVAEDDETGNSETGVLCNPDPAISQTAPAAKYRPTEDFTRGAHPFELRGVFAFAALDNGRVAIVDVEDFDEACRRPVQANALEEPDFRGCSRDDPSIPVFRVGASDQGKPTVTNEATCNTVEPHRARSAALVRTDADRGVHAPALRSPPKLVSAAGRTLLTDLSVEGRRQPRMLGVNFSEDERGEVHVGSTLRRVDSETAPLEIDPAKAEENSLVLSLVEPRSYPAEEQFTAVYEGKIPDERQGARFDLGTGTATLVDTGLSFCGVGVESQALAAIRGERVGASDTAAFGFQHADYVTITSELLDEDDAYWREGAGRRCGVAEGAAAPGAGFIQCRAQLGTSRAPTAQREFRILDSTPNALTLLPRHMKTAAGQVRVNELVECCFPEAVSYTVRASREWVVAGSSTGFRHNIVTRDGRCVQNPCSSYADVLQSRVIEVSCEGGPDVCPVGSDGKAAIGPATAEDVACRVNEQSGLTSESLRTLGEPGRGCAYAGLTSRFVIYRGLEPSERDMTFSWQIVGGFSPIGIDLAPSNDPNTSFQSMFFSPEADSLVITDGSTKGLMLLNLANDFGLTSYL